MELNDKQLHILQTAERLFAEDGFDGTSIRDIAREADINIAMISYYFGSKEKMLEHMIVNRAEDLGIRLQSLADVDMDPFEKIDRIIEMYIQRLSKNAGIYRIIHFEVNFKKRDIDTTRFAQVKRQNLELLERIIREGQEKGAFSKNVNCRLIPVTVLGTYFQFSNNAAFYKEMLGLATDADYEAYMNTELISHLKLTIKALLTHDK
jgi:AcrR family transcriptional regulator